MSSSSFGISGAVTATESYAPTQAQDIRTIERRIADFVTAWNKHDPARMALLWHDDGDLINPFGRIAKGRDQVLQLLRDEHSGLTKNCTNQFNITSIRLATDDVAVVDIESTMIGMRDADGKGMPPFKPHVLLVLSKKDGEWGVVSARPYAYATCPGKAS